MMNKNECALADWYAIGHGDGVKGSTSSLFNQYRKACAEHGISADFTGYMKGYDSGLFVYCTPERGYNLGKSNQPFPSHCPTDLIEQVRHGYNLGKNIFLEKIQINEEIDSFERESKAIDEQLEVLIQEKAEYEEQLQIAIETIRDPKSEQRDRMFAYSHKEKMQELIDKKISILQILESKKTYYLNTIRELEGKSLRIDSQPMPNLRLQKDKS